MLSPETTLLLEPSLLQSSLFLLYTGISSSSRKLAFDVYDSSCSIRLNPYNSLKYVSLSLSLPIGKDTNDWLLALPILDFFCISGL